MKLFCKYSVAQNCQKSLMTYIFVGHIMKFVAGLCLFITAALIRISIGTRISFLTRHYSMVTVPAVLIITGVAMILESVAALKFCFKCLETKSEFTKFETVSKSYFCYFITSCFVSLLTTITVLVFVYELQIIHYAFKRGISDAMKLYQTDIIVKEEFDVLQMKYECCGLESYKEWFQVKWKEDKYLTSERRVKTKKSDKYFIDDVPFSCCDKTIMYPCISERVLDEKAHYGYNYKINLTLYKTGCLESLWKFYGKQTFMKIALILLIVMCFQISLAVSSRLLQTSMLSTWRGDEPPVGWIISLNSGDTETITVEDSEEIPWT